MSKLKAFVFSILCFTTLDFIWLGAVAKQFNLNQLRNIARIKDGNIKIQWPAAIFVYLLMAIMFIVFLKPKIAGKSSIESFLFGGLMGLLIYGIYDMTNYAFIKDYPIPFALADMAWGTAIFGITASIVSFFKV